MSRFARRSPLIVFLLALSAYALSAQVWSHAVSLAPHYVYLAHALLQRHVDLIQLPPTTYDLLHFNGRWFVAGSPMPSLMLLPFVALFGVGFSDVLFSVILGALDVALVYVLLGSFVGSASWHSERSAAESKSARSLMISESARRWITLLFAVGTPFWYLASLGTYWFTAQVVVVFFTLLATREALTHQRWFIAGLWLACAGFARPTALFLAPFFVIVILYSSRVTHHSSRITYYVLRNMLLFAAALVIGIGAHFAYNYARFKSFTDFGYAYVTGADNITSVYARYGGFNLRFAPCNLAVSLLSPPEIQGAVPPFITQTCAYLLEGVNVSDASAPITPNPLGMSIFFVTPALLIVFATLKPAGESNSRLRDSSAPTPAGEPHPHHSATLRVPWPSGTPPSWTLSRGLTRRVFKLPEPLILAAWVGLFTTLIPLWFYHNTGSLQFGWRYLFDAAPMWIILLAAGMPRVTRLKQGLILVSIAINAWGMWWMFGKLYG